ncbi:unnamed protein product, partial [Clonostachys chloroleuca]
MITIETTAVPGDPGAPPSPTSGSATPPKQPLTPPPSRPFASDTNPDRGQAARAPLGTWWNLPWEGS